MAGVARSRAVLERFGERAASLADWSGMFASIGLPVPVVRGLRFVFYWRSSDADRQDPATSRGWQLPRAQAVTAGHGVIVREVVDAGIAREVLPARRPGAGALLAELASPDRDFDAIVIGSYERAFCGNQFSLVAPVLAHHGVGLWLPEVGGPVDAGIATAQDLVDLLEILARREVALKRARSIGAMQYAVEQLGRFMGGRSPYGYVFVDVAPHPNRRLACRGVTLQQLWPHPETSQVVVWIFQARAQERTYKGIARALNEAEIPCPSAADPERNQHRAQVGWTEGAVREILLNPVYTGRTVWGRERAERVLVDVDNPALGYRKVRRRTTPDQWTISERPTHPALVTEREFLTVQGMRVVRAAGAHTYRLTGLLACAVCGRRMEGAWSHGSPAYRCRHGHSSATAADPAAVGNTSVRERDLLARLPLLHTRLEPARLALGRAAGAGARKARKTSSSTAIATATSASPEEVIDYLRRRALVLSFDPATRTLQADSQPPAHVTV